METKTKEQLQKELAEIERIELAEKEQKELEDNYKRFMERPSDWFIGKAHADLSFINTRYSSDRNGALLPHSVSISGNCGRIYQGQAPITSATKTYFHNVWHTSYTRNENIFQEKLTKLVEEEVTKICKQLPVVLEMMGLQSLHYHLTPKFFPSDKLNAVKAEIERSQKEILDTYSDEEFLALLREKPAYQDPDGEYERDASTEIDLTHSEMILQRYIFQNRPKVLEAYKETGFYKNCKDRIEAKYD